MDWLCPGYSSVLAHVLEMNHGNLTAQVTIRDIVPIVQTGDLHIAVYDLTGGLVYVANAKADWESGPVYAYDRYQYQTNTVTQSLTITTSDSLLADLLFV